MIRRGAASLLLLGLVHVTPVQAEPQERPVDGAAVRALIAEAGRAAGVTADPVLSARRGFPPCGADLLVAPMDDGWRAVRVSCDGTGAWSRVIRLRGGSAPAPASGTGAPKLERPARAALVLIQSLARGTILRAEHLETRDVPAAGQHAALRDPGEAIGRRLRGNLGAGQPLLARHLEQDWAVTEGAPVTIVAGDGRASIEVAGAALENGQMGEAIRARNRSSGQIVHARVVGPNKVAVRPNMR